MKIISLTLAIKVTNKGKICCSKKFKEYRNEYIENPRCGTCIKIKGFNKISYLLYFKIIYGFFTQYLIYKFYLVVVLNG